MSYNSKISAQRVDTLKENQVFVKIRLGIPCLKLLRVTKVFDTVTESVEEDGTIRYLKNETLVCPINSPSSIAIDNSSLSLVIKSNEMRKALGIVVKGYEDDCFDQMNSRDKVFYKVCKDALDFYNKTIR